MRQDALQQLRPAFEQLRLPWLCPAQLRYESQTRKNSIIAASSNPASSGTPAKKYAELQRTSSRRCLASAAGAERRTTLEDYIPFDYSPAVIRSAPTLLAEVAQNRRRSDLKVFDPSTPIIINDSLAIAPRRFKGWNGLPGDPVEIQLTLDACLKVGNLQRAAMLVQRLGKTYTSESPQLLEAHNNYIRANVENIIRSKDQNVLQALQKWYEVELRLRGMEGNPTTFALLLKASLQVGQGPKMERTVRRYMDLVSKAQLRDETLSLPILSEAELGLITQVSGFTHRRIVLRLTITDLSARFQQRR